MKKYLLTVLISLFSVMCLIAQPMPNQNPQNNPSASTSAPTQSSITTLSVEHNDVLMVVLCLIAVSAIYVVSKRKSVNA